MSIIQELVGQHRPAAHSLQDPYPISIPDIHLKYIETTRCPISSASYHLQGPLKASNTDLHNKAKISTVNIRPNYLSKKYLTKAINTNNELINILIVNRNSTLDPLTTTLLDIMGLAGSGASVTPQKGLAVKG